MLEKLAENHDLWVSMVVGMGCNESLAQDITQEMYIRMYRLVKDENKIMYSDDEVNKFFVYVTLKNMYYTYLRINNRHKFFEYQEFDSFESDDGLYNEEVDDEFEEAFNNFTSSIYSEISTWHPYNSKLASIYLKSSLSLRAISKDTGISLTSIFNSVKNYKKALREKFKEDYQDLINEDFNHLKKIK